MKFYTYRKRARGNRSRAGKAAIALLAAGIVALSPMSMDTAAAAEISGDLYVFGGGGGGAGGSGGGGGGGGGIVYDVSADGDYVFKGGGVGDTYSSTDGGTGGVAGGGGGGSDSVSGNKGGNAGFTGVTNGEATYAGGAGSINSSGTDGGGYDFAPSSDSVTISGIDVTVDKGVDAVGAAGGDGGSATATATDDLEIGDSLIVCGGDGGGGDGGGNGGNAILDAREYTVSIKNDLLVRGGADGKGGNAEFYAKTLIANGVGNEQKFSFNPVGRTIKVAVQKLLVRNDVNITGSGHLTPDIESLTIKGRTTLTIDEGWDLGGVKISVEGSGEATLKVDGDDGEVLSGTPNLNSEVKWFTSVDGFKYVEFTPKPGKELPEDTIALKGDSLRYSLTVKNGTVNNGSGDGSYKAGDEVNIVADPPESGKVFAYWTGGNDGFIGDKNSPETMFTMPGNDAVVTAHYKSIGGGGGGGGYSSYYIVSFDTGGGSAVDDQRISSGGKVAKPSDPVMSGYSFEGWVKAGADTLYDFDSRVSYDFTLKAKWSKNEPATATATAQTDKHIAYLSGYGDGTVRPDNSITRAEAAMVFFMLLDDADKSEQYSADYRDISPSDWYYEAVACLSEKEMIMGYPDGSFRADKPITRAEFASMAALFGDSGESSSNIFGDVEDDFWAAPPINSVASKGWVTGYPDGSFRPLRFITRAEVATIVNGMQNRKIEAADIPQGANKFSDIYSGHWAYCDIVEASTDHEFTRKANGYELWQ